MAPARQASLSLSAHVPDLDRPLRTTVSWFDVAGWRVAFTDLDGPPDTTAVTVAPGEAVALSAAEPDAPNPLLREDATKPPPRYSPAALVKQMKESGIGRPSTYVSTVDKLLNKKLVEADSGLKPTEAGRGVWLGAAPLFVAASGEPIFETDYTRRLEETLDAVARGEEAAPGVWLRLRDTFKASLLEAQAARKRGQLTPKTRARLEDFLAANTELAAEAGDLDAHRGRGPRPSGALPPGRRRPPALGGRGVLPRQAPDGGRPERRRGRGGRGRRGQRAAHARRRLCPHRPPPAARRPRRGAVPQAAADDPVPRQEGRTRRARGGRPRRRGGPRRPPLAGAAEPAGALIDLLLARTRGRSAGRTQTAQPRPVGGCGGGHPAASGGHLPPPRSAPPPPAPGAPSDAHTRWYRTAS